MSFIFLRYALIFCGVAIVLALCADILINVVLLAGAYVTGGGFAIFARRGGWIAVFAIWWILSFLIAMPLGRKFSGLPFPIF
jgi:hypothetical protein